MSSSTPRSPQTPILTTGSVSSEVSLLFRTKRVSEIRQFESKIREEAEEKSDSLRDLLGTRYKDLLQAADRMAAIHERSVTSVRDALRDMTHSAASLREQFLKKGQRAADPVSVNDDLERRRGVHVVGSKLKHIVDSPEVLYACLEAGEIYDAAVRYTHAARNFREVTSTSGLEGVANRFAERRWQQVQVFKEQILNAAEKQLVSPSLDSTVYARVLASLIMLTDTNRNVVAILDGMLASRTTWIEDENCNTGGAVPAKMKRIAAIVKETITCLYNMFWSDGEGVETLLRDVDDTAADEIATVRKNGALNATCVSWTRSVNGWLEEHGKGILDGAKTSRVLADTLRATDEVFEVEEWKKHCRGTLQQEPSFVFDIFKPFISDRAAVVASECIERAVDKVLSDIDGVWSEISVGPHVGKLIWTTVSSEAVGLNSNEMGEGDVSFTEESDVARILGCNSQISSVVGIFESSLQEALTDVTVLTQRIPSVSDAFDSSVRSCLPRILESLKERLRLIPTTVADDSANKDEACDNQLERALFIARAATALGSAECVQSAYCFSVPDDECSSGRNAALAEFRRTSDALSAAGYGTWASRLCARLKRQLLSGLTSEKALYVRTGWSSGEAMASESKEVAAAESALRYPTTASTALVKFLLNACSAANRAGGFALPYDAIQFLRDEILQAAEEVYEEALAFYIKDATDSAMGDSSESPTRKGEGTDTAGMQMLFDLLALQQFFGTAEMDTGATAKTGLKSVEAKVQASVDPIDLAACRKALREAVFGYTSRSSVLFGTITRSNAGRVSHAKLPLTSTGVSTSSSLVPLSRPVSRFTYLPAPMPSTYSVTSAGRAGLNAKAAIGMLRTEATAANGASFRKRDLDTSVAEYASKVSESVGRFGRGFFESLTRNVG